MARRQTLVQLFDELFALLDERAVRTGRSRSELIRAAVEHEFAEDRAEAIDASIVEAYRRAPPPEHDRWAEASARRSIATEPW